MGKLITLAVRVHELELRAEGTSGAQAKKYLMMAAAGRNVVRRGLSVVYDDPS